jgi:hypothetical protein
MQAPHPPQKKTAPKNKVWAKKAFKKNLGNEWIYFRTVRKFWAARKIM